MDELNKSILQYNNTHITTGIHGTRYLFPLLTEMSHPELAYDLLNARDYPSYGFMMAQGATTIWEVWQHKVGPRTNSHNHPALAAIAAFFVESPAGIQLDKASPGYRHFILAPQITRELTHASASLDTPQGRIQINWQRTASGYKVHAEVPPNSTATIVLPKINRDSPAVQHNGKEEAARRVLPYPKNGFEYELTGGRHHFVVLLD